MTRDQIEHVLRAAGAITGRNEWVIVGSQASRRCGWPDAHDGAGEVAASSAP